MPPMGYEQTTPPPPMFYGGGPRVNALIGVGPGDIPIPAPPGPFATGPPPSSIGGPSLSDPELAGFAQRIHAIAMALQGQMRPEVGRPIGDPRRRPAREQMPWAFGMQRANPVAPPVLGMLGPGAGPQPFQRRPRGLPFR